MSEKDFIPSIEQQNIFNFFAKGIGNAVINAKAGSGKSTTILNALNYITSDKKVLLIAHNKSVADHLKNKCKRNIKDKNGKVITNILTYHALGYKILQENLKIKFKIDEYKYISQIHKNLSVYSKGETLSLSSNKLKRYKTNVKKLINYARYNKCQNAKEIDNIAKSKYFLPIVGNEAITVEELLKWGKSNLNVIDFTDMLWLPYELNLSTRWMLSDWIIVDEAQDTSPIQQDLFMKCMKRGARYAIVGDEDQCINVWCGSDIEALKKFSKETRTSNFPLNTSYRCPKKIIELANKLVKDINYANNAIDGEVNYETNPLNANNGDMVLCRNIAPLAKLYGDILKNGKKAYIKGTDISDDLITEIENTEQNEINCDLNQIGVMSELYRSLYNVWKDTADEYEIEMTDALYTHNVMNMYDLIKTIEALSYDINTKDELIERIKTIFTDNESEGIMLSSVHKAKGLEADNVYLLCPSLIPSKLAKQEWEETSEKNLYYVAITRAKKTLNYVSERLYPPGNGFFGNLVLLDELSNIFDKITNLYKDI